MHVVLRLLEPREWGSNGDVLGQQGGSKVVTLVRCQWFIKWLILLENI